METMVTAKAGTEAGGVPRAVLGAVLVAAALYAVLAAPGLVSYRDSTVPAHAREARR